MTVVVNADASRDARGRLKRAKTALESAPAPRASTAFVSPGELIPGVEVGDFLRGHGTRAFAIASATDEDEQTLVATTAGVVERVNKLVSVRALKSRYVPETGDVVLGRVKNISGKRWIVEINARQNGVLQLSAVHLPGNVQRRRNDVDELNMRSLYAEDDVVSAEVQSVYSDGAAALHTRSLKYGRLKRGQLVRVTANLVRRLPQHFHRLSMDDFGDNVASGVNDVELLLGCNGYIWVGAPGAATAPRETDVRREPTNDVVDELNEAYGDEVHLTQRENITRVANAVRALAEVFLPISPPAVLDVFKMSIEWGVAAKDMQSRGFLTRIVEREVEKRAAAYEG